MRALNRAAAAVGGSAVLAVAGAGIASAATAPVDTNDGTLAPCTEQVNDQKAVETDAGALQDAKEKLAFWQNKLAEDTITQTNAAHAKYVAQNALTKAAQDLQAASDNYTNVHGTYKDAAHAKYVAQAAYDTAKTASDKALTAYTAASKARGIANAANNDAQAEFQRLTELRGQLSKEVRNLQPGFDAATADILYRQNLIAAMQQKLPGWIQQRDAAQSALNQATQAETTGKHAINVDRADITRREGYLAAFQAKLPIYQAKADAAEKQRVLDQRRSDKAESEGHHQNSLNYAAKAAQDAAERDAALAQVAHYGPASQAVQQGHIDKDNAEITQAVAAVHAAQSAEQVAQADLDAAQKQVDHYTQGQVYAQQHINADQQIIDHFNDVNTHFAQVTHDRGVAAANKRDTQRAYDAAGDAFDHAKTIKVAADKVAEDAQTELDAAVAALQVAIQHDKDALAAKNAAQRAADQAEQTRDAAVTAVKAANATVDTDNAKVNFWQSQVAMWQAILDQMKAKLEHVVCPGDVVTNAGGPTSTGGLLPMSTTNGTVTPAAFVMTGSQSDTSGGTEDAGSGAPTVTAKNLAETGVSDLPWQLGSGLAALLLGATGLTLLRRKARS